MSPLDLTDSAIMKFDLATPQANVLEAFCDFIDSFGYEYEAIAKYPPAGEATEQLNWVTLKNLCRL